MLTAPQVPARCQRRNTGLLAIGAMHFRNRLNSSGPNTPHRFDNKGFVADGNAAELRAGKYGYQQNCCKSRWLALRVHVVIKSWSAKYRITLDLFELRGAEIDVMALATASITFGSLNVVRKAAMKKRRMQGIAIALVAVTLLGTSAEAYSEKVKQACSADYGSLCAKYKQGSSELRRCFESNRRVLSLDCVQALVNAGEVPARYLKQR
jgi:hypothetical protein